MGAGVHPVRARRPADHHLKGTEPVTLPKIKSAVRRARLRLAKTVAPAGADVHDPDDTVCPSLQDLLAAVFFQGLTYQADETWLLDVTDDLDYLKDRGLVEMFKGDPCLTGDGEVALARLWGPGRVPPWGGTLGTCEVHGDYDVHPGDWIGCPKPHPVGLALAVHMPGRVHW